jgi:hypothetical protein
MHNYDNVANWATIFVILGVIVIVILLRRRKKPMTIASLFQTNLLSLLETAASISTLMEIVALSIMAIKRGVDPVSAFSRYTTLGFIELAFTFFFLTQSQNLINWVGKKVVKDGKYDFVEILWVFPAVIVLTPLFIFCSLPTYIIVQMYFESVGSLRFQHVPAINPFYQVQWVPVTNTEENPMYLELGALAMIYFTPFLNILQMVISPFQTIPKLMKEVKEGKVKEDVVKETSSPIENVTVNRNGLLNLDDTVLALSVIFGWDANKIKIKINEIANRAPGVQSETSSVDEEIEKILKMLSGKGGNSPEYILGYQALEKNHLNLEKELDQVIVNLSQTTTKLRSTNSLEDKQSLENDKRDLEKEKTRLEEEMKANQNKKRAVKDDLKDLCDTIQLSP